MTNALYAAHYCLILAVSDLGFLSTDDAQDR
jgi:hypothetical protein